MLSRCSWSNPVEVGDSGTKVELQLPPNFAFRLKPRHHVRTLQRRRFQQRTCDGSNNGF